MQWPIIILILFKTHLLLVTCIRVLSTMFMLPVTYMLPCYKLSRVLVSEDPTCSYTHVSTWLHVYILHVMHACYSFRLIVTYSNMIFSYYSVIITKHLHPRVHYTCVYIFFINHRYLFHTPCIFIPCLAHPCIHVIIHVIVSTIRTYSF